MFSVGENKVNRSIDEPLPVKQVMFLIKVVLPLSKKNYFICLNESTLKITKKSFFISS